MAFNKSSAWLSQPLRKTNYQLLHTGEPETVIHTHIEILIGRHTHTHTHCIWTQEGGTGRCSILAGAVSNNQPPPAVGDLAWRSLEGTRNGEEADQVEGSDCFNLFPVWLQKAHFYHSTIRCLCQRTKTQKHERTDRGQHIQDSKGVKNIS